MRNGRNDMPAEQIDLLREQLPKGREAAVLCCAVVLISYQPDGTFIYTEGDESAAGTYTLEDKVLTRQ